jgi:thiamine biosynthesis lipoprotein
MFRYSFLLLVLVVSGCSNEPQVYRFNGHIMGTSYSVKLVADADPIVLDQYAKGIESALVAVDSSMSTYKSESELSRFNRLDINQWQDISEDFYFVLSLAHDISTLSVGAFDVTAGSAVNLWGFGPKGIDKVPSEESIAKILASTGFSALKLNKTTVDDGSYRYQVSKTAPRYVDLSAIAKGFAVDKVTQFLTSQGVDNYLVEVGGEISGAGFKPGKESWNVAVEVPDETQRSIQRILPLKDIAMATSGNYRNFYQFEGTQIGHTIDPRVAKPVLHNLGSVTVLASTCAQADAWATALMVLGEKEGFKLAVEQDLAVLMVVKKGETYSEKMSPRFKAIYQEE